MSIGVHQSHCCAFHGCKYGDDGPHGEGCPVVDGIVRQDHVCETCETYDGIHTLEELDIHMELEKADVELKINALHLGLGKLMQMNPVDKDVDLMRKYLERIVKGLKRGEKWIGVDYYE